METRRSLAEAGTHDRRLLRLGFLLLLAGLLGHVMAAHGTGGRPVDYQHHVVGFFILALATAPIVAGLGWRFWRGRHGVTLVVFGAVQALLGLVIYLDRYRVALNW